LEGEAEGLADLEGDFEGETEGLTLFEGDFDGLTDEDAIYYPYLYTTYTTGYCPGIVEPT
jgi:hypothetical protein